MLDRPPTPEETAAVRTAHREAYAALRPTVRPTHGARELVDGLRGRGVPAVVVTGSGPDATRDVLAEVGAAPLPVVHTGGAVPPKPDPTSLRAGLDALGASAEGAWAVGDSVWDMRAASALGLTAVAVRSGGIGDDALRAAGAEAVVDDAAAVLELVADACDEPARVGA
ncbi:HAD family hydrolase [Motilibacter sp. E257]|uniref:HAD family hydrolase n=1 Tax=Motilibacter deserti TaxID=2714956 RepID=A0ABX0H061_9ACTN|nr:HAD family hydrolase [Motilibacter deserti]